jgi:phosphoribosylamine--glycine ligase
VVLPLLQGGFTDACARIAEGQSPNSLPTGSGAAVTTVLAAKGYPDRPERGAPIALPPDLPPGVMVFHAGTNRDDLNRLRVAGGRVLNVTAVASSFSEAQRLSREAAEQVEFEGKVFRRDIGWREASRLAAVS